MVDARRSVTAGHGPVTSWRPVRAHRRPRPVTLLRVGSRQSRRPRLFEWARRSLTWQARLGSPRVVRPRGRPDPDCFNSLAAGLARHGNRWLRLVSRSPRRLRSFFIATYASCSERRYSFRRSLVFFRIDVRSLSRPRGRGRRWLRLVARSSRGLRSFFSATYASCSERRHSFRRSLVFFRIDVRSSSRPRGHGSEPKFPYRPNGHRCRADCATPCAAPGSFPGGSQAIGRL